jgi:glycosyltransferase involved in cell wall biosynthesis
MKLGVAMITYNQERFVAQAIESFLVEKVNFDFEIVIGEECSTEGTRAVVMDFHSRYPDRIVPILRPSLWRPGTKCSREPKRQTTVGSSCSILSMLLPKERDWSKN